MGQADTQNAIKRSTAVNRSRLQKIQEQQAVLGKIQLDAKGQLVQQLKDEKMQRAFITKLIVQGLLMLLEDKVEVRCRAVDDTVVKACLKAAEAEYAKVVEQETGAKRKVALTLDTSVKLPPPPTGQHGPSCLGGVALACQNGSITIDNTIDARLDLVLEQAKPTIR